MASSYLTLTGAGAVTKSKQSDEETQPDPPKDKANPNTNENTNSLKYTSDTRLNSNVLNVLVGILKYSCPESILTLP